MSSHPPRYAIIGSRGFPSTYGGFETLVRRLAPFLVTQGAEVTVYGRGPGLRVRSRIVDGVRVVDTPGVDTRRASTLSYGLTSAAHAAFGRIDAALVLNVANGYWLPFLKAAGVPTAVNVDGIEWQRDKWSGFGKAVFRGGAWMTARTAERLIVDSWAIGDYWQNTYGVSSEFIPYGADISHDDAHDRIADLGIVPGRYLLVVARLVPENNVDLFLDALDMVREDHPTVVVGSERGASALEGRLEHTQRTRPGFRWLGHVSDQELLRQLWRHCGLYVHGHSVGGTNPALLQALGAGSPTIALDTVYNREVLGGGGRTFPAGDPRRLAELIDAVMSDAAERERLASAGQAVVEQRYRWADVLRAYETVLHDIARGAA